VVIRWILRISARKPFFGIIFPLKATRPRLLSRQQEDNQRREQEDNQRQHSGYA
jgi:hypothetical protein